MRSRFHRHLASLSPPRGTPRSLLATTAFSTVQKLPPETSARDYAILLLHVGAEIEHALMVQYLYAAYSLGGPQVAPAQQELVRGWQETLLGIAKEEMGHLITVQNILRLIGGPLCLDREDFPYDSEFYPFSFKLERFSRISLAKYVYAESPEDFSGPLADEIKAIAQDGSSLPLVRVGKLYDRIATLFADTTLIRDADLRAATYPFQASWDEWGRGYHGGARGNTSGAGPAGTPDVIIRPVASRNDALAAIEAIAQQGEAPKSQDSATPSHFARFLRIYEELNKHPELAPARPVPDNPYAPADLDGDGTTAERPGTAITHPEARAWAHLHNVRYRMLLTYLTHTYRITDGASAVGHPSPRGFLIHSTFGEMYIIRAIAGLLVRTPLGEEPGDDRVAAPPFEMPYTLELPADEVDCYRLHVDLLDASLRLIDELDPKVGSERRAYLDALRAADRGTRTTIETILRGSRAGRG